LNHKWDNIYNLAKDFRENLAEKSKDPVLSKEIEIDEMYQSAGRKGRRKSKIFGHQKSMIFEGVKKNIQEPEDLKEGEEELTKKINHQ
jgi:hypothetical protein